jgi:hypothetical protein
MTGFKATSEYAGQRMSMLTCNALNSACESVRLPRCMPLPPPERPAGRGVPLGAWTLLIGLGSARRRPVVLAVVNGLASLRFGAGGR